MGVKKVVYLLAVLLILSACGQSQESEKDHSGEKWSEIQQSGEIVVGTAGTLYPASYYPEGSDRLTGYNIEVIRELASRLGLDVKFEIMAFDAKLAALQSGRVDVIMAGPREESKDKFLFSEPIKYSYSTMIVRSEDHSGIESLEDLKGKKAGGAATTVYSDIARKYGAEVVTYGNATNDVYLRDVDNGRTDVVINDYYLQSLALKAFPEMDIKLHPDLRFHPQTVSIVTERGANVLTQKINGVLEEMKEDETLTEISQQFFGGQDVSQKLEEDIKEIEGIQ
ncbi:transporter substrate-binding domain-containing protein [Paraliobacillus sp. PM-2]|uniref:transporter substrate-binding domain-containing protein n=1 Tax=Paraliobacillus sp. PM-2 TaxID=1462524 RepID=UPI000B8121B4|nr:transporter substrate-binding domain-containing protein [Paraliobacillus sp. PM-2]